MKRFERRRVERIRTVVVTAGLGFALGALADVGLTWRAGSPDDRPVPPPVAAARPADTGSGPREAPHPVATTGEADDVDTLRDRHLTIPVQGVDGDDLRDTFTDTRDRTRSHEAIDIMAPRRTPVVAVEDGTIAKLFTSKLGGLTIYQFEPSGRFSYYYAHLDGYAPGLAEKQAVQRGQVLGYVGSTGNASASAPHLHFGIYRLTAERQWWTGAPLNPYDILK